MSDRVTRADMRTLLGSISVNRLIRRCVLIALTLGVAALVLYSSPRTPVLLSRADAPRTPVQSYHRRQRAQQQRWQQCRKVLTLSGNHFFWEGRVGDGRCKKTQRSVEEMLQGVQTLRHSRPGAPDVRIVFLGDSRVRVIHETLARRLGLRHDTRSQIPEHYYDLFHSAEELRRAIPSAEQLADLPAGCVEAHVMLPKSSMVRCSLAAAGHGVRSEFWWRPYVRTGFRERLAWLADECQRSQCPDLVVLDSGPWYAKINRFPGDRASTRAAAFAEDVAAARPLLVRLAARTRLIWKIDEQFMPELVHGERNLTRAFLTLMPLVYEVASLIPNLTVMSSTVVEAAQFYHTVCLQHQHALKESTSDQVRLECLDPMHVGETVRWKIIQSLFDVVLSDVTPATPGFCCGA